MLLEARELEVIFTADLPVCFDFNSFTWHLYILSFAFMEVCLFLINLIVNQADEGTPPTCKTVMVCNLLGRIVVIFALAFMIVKKISPVAFLLLVLWVVLMRRCIVLPASCAAVIAEWRKIHSVFLSKFCLMGPDNKLLNVGFHFPFFFVATGNMKCNLVALIFLRD